MEEIRKCPCNFERWSVACDLSRGWPAARNQLSMWMGYQSRQGWHHMMLTALIHSSSLRELTEISSSFFSKPLFMKKRGGGLRGVFSGGSKWLWSNIVYMYLHHASWCSRQCKLIKSKQSYRVYVLFWNSSNNVFKDWGIFTASGVVQVLIWF